MIWGRSERAALADKYKPVFGEMSFAAHGKRVLHLAGNLKHIMGHALYLEI